MKRRILLLVLGCGLLLTGAGCMNKALLDSYQAYLDSAGQEHLQYIKTKKWVDGTPLDDNAIKARQMNYDTSKAVIQEARDYYNKWYIW